MILHGLSKSKLVNAWQCGKRLWLEKYRAELNEVTPDMQQRFDTGHAVGAIAQAQFPGGVLIEHDDDLDAALFETEDRLAEPGPVTLFEATFRAEGVLVRADVLVRDADGHVRVIEVKSSGEVKNYHLQDCAIQLWVLEESGLHVDQIELAHINKEFVYPGNGDYAGLLTCANVTAEARALQPRVPLLITEARQVLDGPEPDIGPGGHCKKPYECPFLDYCLDQVCDGAEWPVHWLPGGMTVHAPLLDAGYRDIRDIPEGYLTSAAAEWCRRVTASGEAELQPAAAEVLAELPWPRYYLDFETLAPAVPVFRDTRPFQMQVFQWSCHIEHEDGRVEHREYLPATMAEDGEALLRACAEALLDALRESGPVLMYTGYEKRVINSLIERCPDLAMALDAVVERLFDLHPVVKQHYYHPDMHGSWSIKAVLPTVAPDLSYAELEDVTVGTEAGGRFLEMLEPATEPERAARLRAALLEYCKLDTLAMVRLAWFLEGRVDAEHRRQGVNTGG